MPRRHRPAHRASSLTGALAALAALAVTSGCGGKETVPVAEWADTVMADGIDGLPAAINEANEGIDGQNTDSCDVIVDWADEARQLPLPDHDELAAAWNDYISAGEAYGRFGCRATDTATLHEYSDAISAALQDMRDAIDTM